MVGAAVGTERKQGEGRESGAHARMVSTELLAIGRYSATALSSGGRSKRRLRSLARCRPGGERQDRRLHTSTGGKERSGAAGGAGASGGRKSEVAVGGAAAGGGCVACVSTSFSSHAASRLLKLLGEVRVGLDAEVARGVGAEAVLKARERAADAQRSEERSSILTTTRRHQEIAQPMNERRPWKEIEQTRSSSGASPLRAFLTAAPAPSGARAELDEVLAQRARLGDGVAAEALEAGAGGLGEAGDGARLELLAEAAARPGGLRERSGEQCCEGKAEIGAREGYDWPGQQIPPCNITAGMMHMLRILCAC